MSHPHQRDASFTQRAHVAEQHLPLCILKPRCRLVENQHLRVEGQSLDDLDRSLLQCTELRDRGSQFCSRDAEVRGEVAHLLLHAPAVRGQRQAQRLLRDLSTKEDIVQRRQGGHERELLVDRGDTCGHRGERARRGERRAVEVDGASIRLRHARDDADERRLPCAVAAEESMNLPGADRQLYVFEGGHAFEVLGDSTRFEHGWRRYRVVRSHALAPLPCRCSDHPPLRVRYIQ